MPFVEIGAITGFVNYEATEPNTIIAEGTWTGTKEGKFGKDRIIEDDNGTRKILPSAGHLNYLFSTLKEGEYLRITYLGKEPARTGKFAGKLTHNFKMERDVTRSHKPVPVPTSVGNVDPEVVEEETPF